MTDFKNRCKRRSKLLAAGLLLAATATSQAAPVSFGIAGASIARGSGYGIDTGRNPENGGTLLDVRFVGSFVAQAFALASDGDSASFDLATVNFAEPNTGNGGNLGIRGAELNDLGLTTSFNFTGPVAGTVHLTALVTANAGAINDAAVDYAVAWNPVEVDFGGSSFRLSVGPLSFSDTAGTQTARATIELLPTPDLRVAVVPEPTSLALAGIAFAGAGFVRRRRTA